MHDLYFFYSAKMAVVFILMFLSATLEAQRNENDKFFDLMTAIGKDFGGEFNDAEKALEIDLNGVNAILEGLHTFAIREIVRKNENGEFECKKSKKPEFKMAIQAILGPNMRNLLKAHIVPKQSESVLNSVYTIKTIFDDKSFKTVENLLNELSEKFSEEKLFNLLFSLAARLEALVHGKNIDGTLKEKKENSKDKIQTFLAVSKCFILPEWESSIFDYWIKIIEMKTKAIFGVAIYKEKYDEFKSEDSKEVAFIISRENYKILKHLNDQKFSIYESLNLLRATFNRAYTTNNYGDEATNPRNAAQLGKQKHILRGFVNLLNQIYSVFYFNWKLNNDWDQNKKCEYAMLFQNISENLMKMMSDKMIDPELHLESIDFKIQKDVQKDVEDCKTFDNEEAKIIFLNNVHYELAINVEFNKRKEIHDRAEGLLSDWVGGNSLIDMYGIYPLSEESYLKKNASKMLRKIKHFTNNTNREAISIIEALIEKEHFKQLNLVSLFDCIKTLVEETIPEEEANFEKAKKEINTKELENDIEFLKKNPERIAEEKYEKAVAIICTIKQFGKKVKMLKSKIKTIEIKAIEIKKNLKKLLSTLQKNKMKYFGPELWKQTKEFCKIEQIELEEIVSEEMLLYDIQFEFYQIWKSIEGGLKGIKEYYLSIPLMQLIERARSLAKTFGKMLENVKEHYP